MQNKNILTNMNEDIKSADKHDSVLDSDQNSVPVKIYKLPKDIIVCTCGKSVTRGSLPYHIRTPDHLKKEKELKEKNIADMLSNDNLLNNTDKQLNNTDLEKSKTKLCSCGQRVSISNYASHLKRRVHINKMAAQTAQIEEIDKMNVSTEIKKILIDKIIIKKE